MKILGLKPGWLLYYIAGIYHLIKSISGARGQVRARLNDVMRKTN